MNPVGESVAAAVLLTDVSVLLLLVDWALGGETATLRRLQVMLCLETVKSSKTWKCSSVHRQWQRGRSSSV